MRVVIAAITDRRPEGWSDGLLVHVERAVHLDLQGVQAVARPAVVACGEAAGVGQVAVDGEPTRLRVRSASWVTAGAHAVP